jgi:glycosyltransferase involved in cell wall biosynthesis
LHVALLHPTYWPEVRRGSERVVHDLAAALARGGQEVTVLTSHRAAPTETFEDGFRVVRNYRPPTRPLHRRAFEYQLTNAPAAALSVLRRRPDVAHALFHVDAVAALMARRFGGPPVVFSCHGIPTASYMEARRLRAPLMRRAGRAADCVTVLSEAAASEFERQLGRVPTVVPGGVDRAAFGVERERDADPTLICSASLNDPRKRAGLLLRAFEALRERRPGARLLLAGEPDPQLFAGELELPPGAQLLPVSGTPELARAYARAWATVLPSVHEAFGLVLVESLAAGTPVVAARSGACPEIVTSPRLGRLFDPDDEAALAQAMDETLDLAADATTARACRERAAAYDWDVVAERFLELYRRAAA